MSKVSMKEINMIAAPAVLSAVAEPLIALLDNGVLKAYTQNPTLIIGCVGMASSFFLMVIWIFSQTRTAMSTLVAQHYGSRRLYYIRNLVPQMIWLNFTVGILFTLLAKTFATQIFAIYDASGEILEKTVEYFQVRAWGYPFTLATLLIFGVFRGLQNTMWTMMITLGGASLNLTLDILFLKGIPGWLEPMGIQGIAFSSVIAQVLMFVVSLFFYARYTPFPVFFKFKRHFHFTWFMRMSGNLMVRSLAVNIVYFFSTRFATHYSTHIHPAYLAVQTVCLQIWFFFAFFIEGYCNAGNALVGKYVGQRNKKSLEDITGLMRTMSMRVAIFISVLLIILYIPLALMFLEEGMARTLFYQTFWLIILMQPIISVAFVYDDFMKGAGNMKQLRNVLIVATFGGFIPSLFIMDGLGLGLISIWGGFNVWMLYRALLLRRSFNIYLDKFDEKSPLFR